MHTIESLKEEIDYLGDELARSMVFQKELMKALQFYAKQENYWWRNKEHGYPVDHFSNELWMQGDKLKYFLASKVDEDQGAIAKEVLGRAPFVVL